jgi:hypothetical protein
MASRSFSIINFSSASDMPFGGAMFVPCLWGKLKSEKEKSTVDFETNYYKPAENGITLKSFNQLIR